MKQSSWTQTSVSLHGPDMLSLHLSVLLEKLQHSNGMDSDFLGPCKVYVAEFVRLQGFCWSLAPYNWFICTCLSSYSIHSFKWNGICYSWDMTACSSKSRRTSTRSCHNVPIILKGHPWYVVYLANTRLRWEALPLIYVMESTLKWYKSPNHPFRT